MLALSHDALLLEDEVLKILDDYEEDHIVADECNKLAQRNQNLGSHVANSYPDIAEEKESIAHK